LGASRPEKGQCSGFAQRPTPSSGPASGGSCQRGRELVRGGERLGEHIFGTCPILEGGRRSGLLGDALQRLLPLGVDVRSGDAEVPLNVLDELPRQHPNVYRSTAAFGPLAENPKRPELRAVSGSGAYRDRTGDLRLAKPNPSFLHQPGLGGIPGASRPFTRCFTGIAGRRRGLPPISCGMQAG
jgi:hypothetical protein